MKDPIEIARDIAGPCEFATPCGPDTRPASNCIRCGLVPEIAAAIVAERGAGTPHFCEIHRATSGEHDCGLEPCEEAKVHKDLGPPRRAKVSVPDVKRALRQAVEDNVAARRALEEIEDPACDRCGGSGEIVRYTGTGSIIFDPCPECGGKP